MKDFLTDEEMKKLENPDFISDEEMAKLEKPSYDYSNLPQVAKDLVKVNVEALPQYGGAIGSLFGPAGAGLGAAAGQSLKGGLEGLYNLATGKQDLANEFRLPTSEELKQLGMEQAGAFAQGYTGEASGQLAGKALQAGAKAFQPQLAKNAERMAARALGAERGTIKKLGADRVQEVGRYALDEGLLQPFSNTDDVIAANLAAQQRGGQMMSDVYKQIDEAGASTFDPLSVAAKVDEELGSFYRDPLNKGVTNQLENTIESILMRGNKPIPLSEAQALKETLGKASNWQNKLVISDKEQLARQAYGIVNKAIDDAVESGAQAIGTDNILKNLQKGKQLFGASKTAEELLTNKLAREQGNKLIGLTDWGVLGAGGAAIPLTGGGSIPATAALYGAKKYGENFGAQQSALLLDKLAKSPTLQNLGQKSPQLFEQFVGRLGQAGMAQLSPEQEQKGLYDKDKIMSKVQGSQYAKVLQDAAQKGDQSFAAAHYVMSSNDEKYRQLVEDQEQ